LYIWGQTIDMGMELWRKAFQGGVIARSIGALGAYKRYAQTVPFIVL
jgi:hypothetical protein